MPSHCCRSAARAGVPEAVEYRVAISYFEGAGVPTSHTEGVRWLGRAAVHGWVDAQAQLAALYVHGLAASASGEPTNGAPTVAGLFAGDSPTAPDFDLALKWARQAADAGSPKGQAILAYVLTYGPEGMRDPEEAHRCYELSASAGCPEGNLGYALSLARPAKNDADRRGVVKQLLLAARAEVPTAVYLLGVMTEEGSAVRPNAASAAELYRRAAEKGNISAQARWGHGAHGRTWRKARSHCRRVMALVGRRLLGISVDVRLPG